MARRPSVQERTRYDARRYRLLRVELTKLRDELRERATATFVWPDQLADRIQRMLDRGSFGGDELAETPEEK